MKKKILIGMILTTISLNSFSLGGGKIVYDPTHTLKTIGIQIKQLEQYSKQLEDLKLKIKNFQRLPLEAFSYTKQGKEIVSILNEINEIQNSAKNTLINVKNFEKGWDLNFPDARKINNNFQAQVDKMLVDMTNMNKIAMKQNQMNFDRQQSTVQDLQMLSNQLKNAGGQTEVLQTTGQILTTLGTTLNQIQSSISAENLATRWEKQEAIQEKQQIQAEIESAKSKANKGIEKARAEQERLKGKK